MNKDQAFEIDTVASQAHKNGVWPDTQVMCAFQKMHCYRGKIVEAGYELVARSCNHYY